MVVAVITSSTISILSCASSTIRGPVRLEERTLSLAPEAPKLVYYQEECVKKKLGICWDYDIVKYEYDLTKPEIRKQLIDMGFVARVRTK